MATLSSLLGRAALADELIEPASCRLELRLTRLSLGVQLAGSVEYVVDGLQAWFRWPKDRVALGVPGLPGWTIMLPAGAFGREHDVLPLL